MAAAAVARAPSALHAPDSFASRLVPASLFAVDLSESAAAQLRLLRAVHAVPRGALYEDGPVLREALRRYPLFLALLEAWGREGNTAPLVLPCDAAWLWHCHKLAPLDYVTDCKAHFGGRVLDVPAGSHPFDFAPWEQGVDGEASATAAAWARLYPSESFHLTPPAEGAEVAAPTAPFVCDLVAAAGRQKQFLWQVSGPQYGNAAFLADATRRYAQLLALMRQLPKAFLVPTYDMDLMWHAHLAWPGAYASDTTALCGRVISHDDSVNNREKGGKLATSAAFTAAAWAEAFPGESWAKRGAMYVGEPPEWYHAAEPRWRGGMPCAEGLGLPAPGYGVAPGGQAMQPGIPGLQPLPPQGSAPGGYPPQQPQYGAPQQPQYGAPQGPQYGAPPPQYGAPQPQYGGPPPPQQYVGPPAGMYAPPMGGQMQQTGPFMMQPNGQPQMMMVTEDTGCCCCPSTTQRAVPVRNPMYRGPAPMMSNGAYYSGGQPMYGGGGYGQPMGGGGGMGGGMGLGIGLIGGGLLGLAVADAMDNDNGGGCGGGGGGCGGGGGGCGGGGCGGGQ